MHDSILFEKIFLGLQKLCEENIIMPITKIDITVRHDSHVYEGSLREYLSWRDPDIIAKDADIKIHRDDIEECTCIINIVEGVKQYE